MKIGFVILSFNEVDGLTHYLPSIARMVNETPLNIFAVDGGSKDGSVQLYQKYKIPYYIQEKKGRGEAFKLAFEKCADDALIFFSPDGNEDIADVPKFCARLSEGADMIIASRMRKGAQNEEDHLIFKWRKWVNQTFTLIANILWNRSGRYVTDSINGFRAIRRDAWAKLRMTAGDYTVEYQSTIRAFKLHLKIMEFPTIERQRLGGESNAKSLPTGIRFLKLLLQEIRLGKNFMTKGSAS
ncbi:MAG: hypothetical protein A2Y04_02105 [Omnitrophica WOR_2 bacterium GWC2_45_7]|nr:MAG: hypothetical protein A2Z81_04470 [Omnitrophica WOR_2 bacterium GWA2_45_18]OGX19811.1 MAG: hypothetical protein A2Y04_02105 [Omnitrophica WOR_2 bacterium GWC2_45_7]